VQEQGQAQGRGRDLIAETDAKKEKGVKILVCGDRNFQNQELMNEVLDALKPVVSLLIAGGARGADTLAENWATLNQIPTQIFPAEWDKHGRAAGTIRNKQMLDEGSPALVIAFPSPNSKGTRHMIRIAKSAGITTHVLEIEV
jgi:hypothetical protein